MVVRGNPVKSRNSFEQRFRAKISSKDFEQQIGIKTEENRLISINQPDLFLAAGGNNSSCVYGHNSTNKEKGWVALGAVVVPNNGGYSFAETAQWEKLISSDIGSQTKLNGHFVVFEWSRENCIISTDALGLRDIYFGIKEDLVYISTRVDWLSQYINCSLNFSRFGSRWKSFNQLSTKSVITGLTRIVCGSKVVIDRGKATVQTKEVKPLSQLFGQIIKSEIPPKEIEQSYLQELGALIEVGNNSGKSNSLALSGGLDSRVLLAVLLGKENQKVDCHTFGEASHIDSVMVQKIIQSNKAIHHKQLQRPFPKVDDCVAELQDYVAQTLVGNPASLVHKLNNAYLLKENYPASGVFIDGAFGEIWRRSFLNRLAFKGQNFLENLDHVAQLFPFTAHKRGSFFNADLENEMKKGIANDLEQLLFYLPKINDIGFENWLDLFAIATRLPNMYGHEQARLDNLALTFMPFLQPSLLKMLWQVPVKNRKNSNLFKRIILENKSELSRFQLAKNDHTQPFGLTTLQSRLWGLARKKLKSIKTVQSTKATYLHHIGEYINDQVLTNEVINSGFYDAKKLRLIQEDFQSKHYNLIDDLDWLVSFETFRRRVT